MFESSIRQVYQFFLIFFILEAGAAIVFIIIKCACGYLSWHSAVSDNTRRPAGTFNFKILYKYFIKRVAFVGIDYTVQFHPLNVHGVSNVVSTLNNAFRQLFDRLTLDMAPHDQVRLILDSHQLDRPISLPFLPRDSLTPERFLAAVERVVQSNDQFTLDESVNVNLVHVAMPQGGVGKRRDVVNLHRYLDKKRCFPSDQKQRRTLLCKSDRGSQSKA